MPNTTTKKGVTILSESNRAFITGCDSNTEWMLKWFIKNYKKHNDTPLVFCDFGITQETRSWLYQVEKIEIIELPKQSVGGWFYKPAALYHSPYKETCWIDTDIQVLGDLSGIFKYVEDDKLGMVEDKPWSKRRGEKWHNSGVVAIRGKPPILKKWMMTCLNNPRIGDQEVLHDMVRINPMMRLMHIADVPNIYNWLRIQLVDGEDNPNKLCMHWTGPKGKDHIRKLMYNE